MRLNIGNNRDGERRPIQIVNFTLPIVTTDRMLEPGFSRRKEAETVNFTANFTEKR